MVNYPTGVDIGQGFARQATELFFLVEPGGQPLLLNPNLFSLEIVLVVHVVVEPKERLMSFEIVGGDNLSSTKMAVERGISGFQKKPKF